MLWINYFFYIIKYFHLHSISLSQSILPCFYLLAFLYVCPGGILQWILNNLSDELETWNLGHSSEVDDNEWKCEKKNKKIKKKLMFHVFILNKIVFFFFSHFYLLSSISELWSKFQSSSSSGSEFKIDCKIPPGQTYKKAS